MTRLLLRTGLIYIFLVFAMRLMGKRQVGQLEISDLVTTFLISEIASLPITDRSIPLSHALVPIVTLVTFEVITSAISASFPKLKNIFTVRPSILIRDGKICISEMKKARISADELISELRQKEITDPTEVRYAILEQNGKITVIPKAASRPPTAKDLSINVNDSGLSRILIDKGTINQHSLSELNISRQDLLAKLRARGLAPKDVYLMLMNDSGNITIVQNKEVNPS